MEIMQFSNNNKTDQFQFHKNKPATQISNKNC